MSPDEIRCALWRLPDSERMAMLACSIIGQHPGAMPAVRALVEFATIMARRLTAEQRFTLAETLRDEADKMERAQVVPIAGQ